MSTRRIALAGLALVFSAVTINVASASCTEKIDHSSSDCLGASWTNPPSYQGWGFLPSFSLTRSCEGYPGKIVAQVRSQFSLYGHKTVSFTGDSASGKLLQGPVSNPYRITGVKCCGGQGICQAVDAVTDASCLAQWNASDASDRCWDAVVTEESSTSTKCQIETTCNNNLDAHGNDQFRIVEFLDVDDLTVNSGGYIQEP